MASECSNARKIDRSHVQQVTAELAWEKIKMGTVEKDMDKAKEGIQEYLKPEPTIQYPQLETAFRSQGIGLYLIAVENPSMFPTHTHMDLQGNLGKKYRVLYRFSPTPHRPREAEHWPSSPEENLTRLQDAGDMVDRGLPLCSNCNELGHISKRCPQEKFEIERVVIKCYNCEQTGHRIRDCKYDENYSHL